MLNEINGLALSDLAWLTTGSAELSSELLAFVLLLCFFGLSNCENRIPRIKGSLTQARFSYQTNLGLFVFNNLLMSACSISTLFVIAENYSSGYAALQYVPNPTLKAILAFLAFDLLLYLWHQVCHRVDVFWVFHRVHHNDPSLNVSTAFRLHFVEVLITNSLKALLIILLGIDKALVLAIESLMTACIMFHHTNASFKHERMLSYFMIVPYLHRVHHSTERNEHDSNYGAVLSVWDRMFGTLLELEPKQIGINGSSPQDLFSLLKLGLGLEAPVRIRPVNLEEMIAEAAYYKAEKRNFYPGYELCDWLEAKKEILNAVYGDDARFGVRDNIKLLGFNIHQAVKQSLRKDFKHFNLQWH
jgi:sterol desaturase/sphingolipid hydroxylase (fatty acid hydroxylase superfamily)